MDLRQLDSGWLRSQLGVVSQDPRLFSESVAANIAYGLPGKSQARPWAAAAVTSTPRLVLMGKQKVARLECVSPYTATLFANQK